MRMTPKKKLDGPPSVTSDFLNGGVRRIDFSWDAVPLQVPAAPGVRRTSVIPNRCLSVPRFVCPRSLILWKESDLPPPRALGMCGSSPATATAEMGRLTDADGNVRKCFRANSGSSTLDSHRFIDAFSCFCLLMKKNRKPVIQSYPQLSAYESISEDWPLLLPTSPCPSRLRQFAAVCG